MAVSSTTRSGTRRANSTAAAPLSRSLVIALRLGGGFLGGGEAVLARGRAAGVLKRAVQHPAEADGDRDEDRGDGGDDQRVFDRARASIVQHASKPHRTPLLPVQRTR